MGQSYVFLSYKRCGLNVTCGKEKRLIKFFLVPPKTDSESNHKTIITDYVGGVGRYCYSTEKINHINKILASSYAKTRIKYITMPSAIAWGEVSEYKVI